MRTIVAGSRDNVEYSDIEDAIKGCGWVPTVVISGGAKGADRHGEEWASRASIPIERYPADWETHGKSAGYIRNQEMAQKADALIAIWNGHSRGTKHMIDIASKKGLIVHIHRVAQ